MIKLGECCGRHFDTYLAANKRRAGIDKVICALDNRLLYAYLLLYERFVASRVNQSPRVLDLIAPRRPSRSLRWTVVDRLPTCHPATCSERVSTPQICSEPHPDSAASLHHLRKCPHSSAWEILTSCSQEAQCLERIRALHIRYQ